MDALVLEGVEIFFGLDESVVFGLGPIGLAGSVVVFGLVLEGFFDFDGSEDVLGFDGSEGAFAFDESDATFGLDSAEVVVFCDLELDFPFALLGLDVPEDLVPLTLTATGMGVTSGDGSVLSTEDIIAESGY